MKCLRVLLLQLKSARVTVNFAFTGSVIGDVSTAGFAWRYSRSLHGSGLLLQQELLSVGHLDGKLPIAGCKFTDWTPWLHRLSLWSGEKGRVRDGLELREQLKVVLKVCCLFLQ
ncbi:Succinate dehydrogenase subunit 6 mitochondrial [Melia azedarach]|uniref:Succinate dehydrogenase subunit 6 mitochondrial n=1 Tax=Melia azedarach TaxID=155640 RepID=A0ACC1Z129_MELAZ|nr:Succinate dehydrogenase subunit 6 mitochondrial [Melia azedarach]